MAGEIPSAERGQPMKMHPRVIDLTGHRFGRLTAVEYLGVAPGGGALWRCRCECGEETKARSQNLRDGAVVSCGCFRRDSEVRRDAVNKVPEARRAKILREARALRWPNKKKRKGK